MNRPLRDDDCPCASGGSFGACCGPVLEGTAAPTAQALMRSRYTAYAVGDPDHLFRSWHPRTRPDDVVLDADLRWEGLEVLSVVDGGAGDDTGEVEFVARARGRDGVVVLQETSRFARRAGRWTYVDGGQRLRAGTRTSRYGSR